MSYWNAKEGEISLAVTCVSLSAENLSNSTTCKFGFILDVFSLCFTKYKVKRYKQKQTKRKTETSTKEEEKPSLYGFRVLRLILSSRWLCEQRTR